jgi:hypothetical protein
MKVARIAAKISTGTGPFLVQAYEQATKTCRSRAGQHDPASFINGLFIV